MASCELRGGEQSVSVPSECDGSAPSTARLPPTSRLRAAGSQATR